MTLYGLRIDFIDIHYQNLYVSTFAFAIINFVI